MHKAKSEVVHLLAYTAVVLCAALLACGSSKTGLAQSGSTQSKGNTTYYVDSQTGNDQNSGTSETQAWKSFTRINNTTFLPGDRILLKSGSIWTGQLWPKGSGKDGQPIVIDKFGGDTKPIINGAGQVEEALKLQNQEYWEVQNLELTNTGASVAFRMGVEVSAINYGEVHHVYLRSLTVHDVNGDNAKKDNGGIIWRVVGGQKASRFVDLRIENNYVYHVDRSGINTTSSHSSRSNWNPSLNVAIRNNVVDDVGGDGIVPQSSDHPVVEYNVVSNANARAGSYNAGIWPWSTDNAVIQYNEAYLTRTTKDGEGFDSDWNSRNTLIQYNYSHDNEGGFLLICNEGASSPSFSAGNVGTVVRYNISQNDRSRSFHISGPLDATIYNNTIYVGKGLDVDLILQSSWDGWAQHTHLYNNIFYVDGKAKFGYAISHNDDGTYNSAPGFGESQDNVFDSNIYYGNIANVPDDARKLTVDPLLTGPGTATKGRSTAAVYAPLKGSPAINSGKVIDGNGGQDFFGASVPSCGAPDRGAIELQDCSK